MGSDNWSQDIIKADINAGTQYLQEFKLYETRSNFYMIGWNTNKDFWKVLKIDRSELSELNILEDPTSYSDIECRELLSRIHEGNKSTGGLKFVTMCYGIVGFIKFLGPYYMLLITKRKKIGKICGHAVYSISKSKMIPIPNSTVQSNMDLSKNENRYKKLLRSVDLTKDFFFSYSYRIMHSLQKNLCNHESGQVLYDTMFVWNEFLTRGIQNHLKSSLWIVALVYGFFKQVNLSISGREFKLTLIARRSRHYAGTRYLKRGVNEKGRVANDVETEQIVFEDLPKGSTMQISSVVQNRGSIPLFWSQETSRLNIKPDIILSQKDQQYLATRLHFDNLVKRYGNPIIILNLIKTQEKKPRESILRAEFVHAISLINKDLKEENRLKFLHWDLNKYSKTKAMDVLSLLCKVAAYALSYTGFFCCQVAPTSGLKGLLNYSLSKNKDDGKLTVLDFSDAQQGTYVQGKDRISSINTINLGNSPTFQKGVLRTNCIDCLDRTNVAQFAFGLVALGQQLHALGFINDPIVDIDSPLADDIMRLYETMGDTLALQYGGSAAHNKIFCQRRGQWMAATQSQELFRTIQRYYSNVYMDFVKQDAINVFLGYFQPQLGKPALWELSSDQHYVIGRHGSSFADENERLLLKRSLSDGNILSESNSSIEETGVAQSEDSNQLASDKRHGGISVLSESTPEISTCETELSYSRYVPSMSSRQLFPDVHLGQCPGSDSVRNKEDKHLLNCSNFLDVDWLSSSGNSWEEDAYERSTLISSSPLANVSSDSVATISNSESGSSLLEPGTSIKNPDVLAEYSDRFVNWVTCGEMFY